MIERHHIRALLIEDDPDDHLLCAEIAAEAPSMRIDLVWESDPARGVERASAETFDVVLLDFQLGGTTGLDVMDQLRSRELGVPIVFLTGQTDAGMDLTVMRRGADDYLGKQELNAWTLQRAIVHAVERRAYIQRIEHRERLHKAVLASLHEGVLAFDTDGAVTTANDRAAWLVGCARNDLIGSETPLEGWVVTDSERAPLPERALPWVSVVEGQRHHADRVIGLWSEGQLQKWLSVNVQPLAKPDGSIEGAVASLADVTEDQAIREELRFKAFHDPLTGLPNRSVLIDRLEQALKVHERSPGSGIAVLFLDLDRFKAINDTWGHRAGDEVLQIVSQRILDQLRSHDTLARISGDEFVILLESVQSVDRAVTVVERIREAVSRPADVEGAHVPISVSIGMALHSGGGVIADGLLERADRALYEAKRAGRNTYRIYMDSPGSDRS